MLALDRFREEGGTEMAKKADEMLGESVVAEVQVEAQASVKDVVGEVIGGALTGFKAKPASLPGDHEGIFHVAVGPTKIGFFSMKRGLFKASLQELLVEHPRSDLKALEIEKGMMPTAHFVFEDGTHYALMCARINHGKLKKMRELLFPE